MESLKLVRNRISDVGFEKLLNVLEQNKTLVTLNLSTNKISDKIFDKLEAFFKLNSCLKNIYLNQNLINANKVKKRVEDLKKNYGVSIFL